MENVTVSEEEDARIREMTELMLRIPEQDRPHWLERLRAIGDREHGEITPAQAALIFYSDKFTDLAAEVLAIRAAAHARRGESAQE